MISIRKDGKDLLVKAIRDLPGFERDRNALLLLENREPRYDDEENFVGWVVAPNRISEVLNLCNEYQTDEASKKVVEAFALASIPARDLPREELKAFRADGSPLKDYQADLVRLPAYKNRLLCAFKCGKGKTTTALMRIKQLQPEPGLIVVAGPKISLPNWDTECKNNLGYGVVQYHGDYDAKERKIIRESVLPKAKVIVTNYQMLKEISEWCRSTKTKVEHIILDEAHIFSRKGNDINKVTKAFVKQFPKASLMLLTGTPVLSNLEDLYQLINLLSPEVAGTESAWIKKYTQVISSIPMSKTVGRYPYTKTIHFTKETRASANVEECHKQISPVVVSLDDDDEIPNKTSIIELPMTKGQVDMYRSLKYELKSEWEGGKIKISNLLTRSLRLLQVSEGTYNITGYFGCNEQMCIDGSNKLAWIVDYLKQAKLEGKKVIVWSRFRPIIEILYNLFKDEAVIAHGSCSLAERKLAELAFNGDYDGVWDLYAGKVPYGKTKTGKDRFYTPKLNKDQDPGRATIYLGTLGFSSSISNNLHKMCYTQIMPSFHTNGTVNHQALARLIRIGQEREVESIILLSKNTLDVDMYYNVTRRFETNGKVITPTRLVVEFLEKD